MKRYLKMFRGALIGYTILTAAIIFSQTFTSVAISKVIDTLIKKNQHQFFFWLLLSIMTTLFMVLADLYSEVWQQKITQSVDTAIRTDLGTGIANMDYQAVTKRTTGEYSSWFNNDISQIEQKGLQSLFNIIMYAFGLLFPIIMLFSYHWLIGVSGIILAVLSTIIPRITTPWVTKATERLTEQNEKLNNVVQNVLGGFEVLFAFHKRAEIPRLIKQQSEVTKAAAVNQSVKSAQAGLVNGLFGQVSQYVIIITTSLLVLNGQLTAGTFYATGNLAGIFVTSFAGLGNAIVSFKSVSAIFKKYQGLDFTPHVDQDFDEEAQPDLAVSQLAVGSQDNNWLAPISFKVPFSYKAFVTGPSGAGKTTLLKTLASLVTPSTGHYSWQDAVTSDNQQVLYVPQATHIFSGSIRYNLTLGSEIADAELWQALTMVHLTARIQQLPQQLDTEISELSNELSGGERQRLCIARATLTKAPVLLLDEVTANVDQDTANAIETAILQEPQRTVLFTSHRSEDGANKLVDQTITVKPVA